jgi:hypothetical protein
VQAPVEQLAAALAREHAVPHAAQLVSDVSAVSQPFASVASQSPKPALHDEMAHAPVEHVGVALVRVHGAAQAPQCVSVLSVCSQPFALRPSQSPSPAAQVVATHVPEAHVSLEPPMSQIVPHVLQSVSVLSGLSQPFAALASQLPQSALHAPSAQVPDAQLAAAFTREHAVPQLAQLVSDVSAVSQPFASVASQFPKPPLHDEIAQVPVAQVAPAFVRVHATPHAPQFAVEVSAASQPFASFPSQFPNPGAHVRI